MAQEFGAAIRTARTERGETLDQVANRIESMDAKYLGEIERGWHAPTIPTAKRIAEALDVPLQNSSAGCSAESDPGRAIPDARGGFALLPGKTPWSRGERNRVTREGSPGAPAKNRIPPPVSVVPNTSRRAGVTRRASRSGQRDPDEFCRREHQHARYNRDGRPASSPMRTGRRPAQAA